MRLFGQLVYPCLIVHFSGMKYIHTVCKHCHHPSPKDFSSCKTETPYLLNTNSPSPQSPDKYHSTFCLYEWTKYLV